MEFKDFIGRSAGPQKIEYNWRDVALYALAVGAHEDESMYMYEKDMKTIPSFGVVPYWSAINNYPQRPRPYPASNIVALALQKQFGNTFGALHMEHDLIIHRPIDPIKGSFVFEDTITNIYDRGEEKGIVVETSLPVYDEAGNLLCENISRTGIFAAGGFGGEKLPKSSVVIPSTSPDYIVSDYVSKTQNFLYRLTGDTNLIHVDPDFAKKAGYQTPFMQGLCSFGFACRMAIRAIIPGEPERLVRFSSQMRNICWPGSEIELHIWKKDDYSAIFQLVHSADGKAILDKGFMAWKK